MHTIIKHAAHLNNISKCRDVAAAGAIARITGPFISFFSFRTFFLFVFFLLLLLLLLLLRDGGIIQLYWVAPVSAPSFDLEISLSMVFLFLFCPHFEFIFIFFVCVSLLFVVFLEAVAVVVVPAVSNRWLRRIHRSFLMAHRFFLYFSKKKEFILKKKTTRTGREKETRNPVPTPFGRVGFAAFPRQVAPLSKLGKKKKLGKIR